jgi:hypothetical protein
MLDAINYILYKMFCASNSARYTVIEGYMEKEFTDTDGELARCIKSRMRHELAILPRNDTARELVREYLRELTAEIIAEEF